jgi:glutathione S-transferase
VTYTFALSTRPLIAPYVSYTFCRNPLDYDPQIRFNASALSFHVVYMDRDSRSSLLTSKILEIVDSASRDYLLNSRIPTKRYQQFIALRSDPEAMSRSLADARAAMKPIDALLRDPSTGPYLHGNKPGHGDFVLFGEYAYARINPNLIRHVWESEELHGVRTWVNMFLRSGLVDQKMLYSS